MIEEILSRLERIDHKEYSCGFEFADSSTFDEMARCFEERKILAKEIERLNKKVKECEEAYLRTRHQYSELEGKYVINDYIINELEKWLVKEKDKKEEIAVAQGLFIDKDLSERLDHQIGTIDYVLDKLQELKGDSSNE